ncbi:hypothetical protein ZWY2020_026976 [Hordeum vulgare]|nr:hypothetical protein ZWY2020_026976 [Hordeum vulgare]
MPRRKSPIPYRHHPLGYTPHKLCLCNQPAGIFISWLQYPGRRYLNCMLPQSAKCKFFEWMVKASASPCGLLELDVKQMEQAKLFQALMFNDKKERKFNTFVKYFEETYGIVLRHPLQPLLALKPSHRPHNLLSSKLRDEGNHVKINGGTSPVNKTDSCVHMPPELLILLNLPEDILRAFYLFPSLMHRIETLMLASQLRSEISYEDSNISSFLILEAITTLRCSENFSMEHLELLGDSVLKYAVSRHLFLKFPDKDEGQLSSSRDDIISNAALYGFGIGHTIQLAKQCSFQKYGVGERVADAAVTARGGGLGGGGFQPSPVWGSWSPVQPSPPGDSSSSASFQPCPSRMTSSTTYRSMPSPLGYHENPLDYKPAKLCNCDPRQQAGLFISWKECLGRRYYSCMRSLSERCSDFLGWADPVFPEHITNLLRYYQDRVDGLALEVDAYRKREQELDGNLEDVMKKLRFG